MKSVTRLLWCWNRQHIYTLPNVYNGLPLPLRQHSCEHLIPKSMFRNTRHANHPWNLAPCDLWTNIKRSNYPLGNIDRLTEDELSRMEVIYDGSRQYTGHLDRSRHIFFPSPSCDRGFISRSFSFMLQEYPYLSNHLDHLIHEKDQIVLLDTWSKSPMSEMEQQRWEWWTTSTQAKKYHRH